jgi:hypothetical protein
LRQQGGLVGVVGGLLVVKVGIANGLKERTIIMNEATGQRFVGDGAASKLEEG